jgi:hypothetical protein
VADDDFPDFASRFITDLPALLQQAKDKAQAEASHYLNGLPTAAAPDPEKRVAAGRRPPAVSANPLVRLDSLALGFEPLVKTESLARLEPLAVIQPLGERATAKGPTGKDRYTDAQLHRAYAIFEDTFNKEIGLLVRARGVG